MTRFVRIATAATLCAIATPAVAQECGADFQFVARPLVIDYNPYSPQPVARTMQMKVRRITRGVTSIRFLLIDLTPDGSRPRLGLDGPSIYDLSWITDTGRTAFGWGAESLNPTNGAIVSFGAATATDVATTAFQLRIPRGQPVPAGLATENLAVRYQCYSGADRVGGEREQRTSAVDLSVRIPRYVAAYLGSAGQTRGSIAFGRLSGEGGIVRRNVAVTALSTIPYDVTFTSDHLGLLKRSDGDTDGLPYRLRYGGAAVDTDGPVICPAVNDSDGRIETLEVALDTSRAAALPAGDYGDVITLTFAPRDGRSGQACRASAR